MCECVLVNVYVSVCVLIELCKLFGVVGQDLFTTSDRLLTTSTGRFPFNSVYVCVCVCVCVCVSVCLFASAFV